MEVTMTKTMRLAIACLAGLTAPATLVSQAQAQEILRDYERETFDSPEGWAMAHTLSSSLNLGALPPEILAPWQWNVSAEMGSIPHLSREEQRVGFGGYKLEDMNKSPVFGRGRVSVGLPGGVAIEASWTPPVQVDGARPEGIYGLALEKSVFDQKGWQLGVRLFALRGEASGATTCSRSVASSPVGSAENPFGCRAPSHDRLRLDHEGIELMASHRIPNSRWQPFIAMAKTQANPYVKIKALVFDSLDLSELETSGSLDTLSIGTVYHATPDWRVSAAFSYTPLDVRRPPLRQSRDANFWSVRLGLAWVGSAR